MDNVFINIIILPMLSYFQLLYDYFSLIKIISPYIIYSYLWQFSNFLGYFLLFHPTLFIAIYDNSLIFLVIFYYFTLGYFWLF